MTGQYIFRLVDTVAWVYNVQKLVRRKARKNKRVLYKLKYELVWLEYIQLEFSVSACKKNHWSDISLLVFW